MVRELYIKRHDEPYFDKQKNETAVSGNDYYDPRDLEFDELIPEALKFCIEIDGATIAMIRKKFGIGWLRAAKIIDQMGDAGYISQGNGSRFRTVYISRSEFKEKFGEELEPQILAEKNRDIVVAKENSNCDPSNPLLDELIPEALEFCIETGGASINMVQRRFSVGYARAARIIDQMELAGYISQGNGSKLRTVYMTMSEFKEKFGED